MAEGESMLSAYRSAVVGATATRPAVIELQSQVRRDVATAYNEDLGSREQNDSAAALWRQHQIHSDRKKVPSITQSIKHCREHSVLTVVPCLA